ncbi:MAG: metallophosphatase family protein, partial [Gemmataceae bacterium]|nr:metallophosphatase family protein [Gemmataceae bacterium]
HFVYGNCDVVYKTSLRQAAADAGMTLHKPYGSLELVGKKVAFIHGDDSKLLHELEQSDEYDYLFYGHTHRAEEHRTGRTRVINPGALHRAQPKTFIVLDLDGGEVESVVVE